MSCRYNLGAAVISDSLRYIFVRDGRVAFSSHSCFLLYSHTLEVDVDDGQRLLCLPAATNNEMFGCTARCGVLARVPECVLKALTE